MANMCLTPPPSGALSSVCPAVTEWGDDVRPISEEEAMVIVNHQSTGDVCTLMMCLQDKGTVRTDGHAGGKNGTRLGWVGAQSLDDGHIFTRWFFSRCGTKLIALLFYEKESERLSVAS